MKIIVLMALGGSAVAQAAGGHDGVPKMMVLFQVINFGLFVGLLTWLLRTKIRDFFTSRQNDFHAARLKAEEAKRLAEKERQEMQERLQKLEASAQESIERAKAEAAELKAEILRDAEEMAAKIREEAERATKYEVENAKQELRRQMLTDALDAARKVVSSNMAEPDQKRLQGEFVEKIQVVR